jgi:glycosyltransferase involved in cell wall biosynthesis
VTAVLRAGDVSVVIPVRNHASLIGEAIESVLQQTLRPGAVIVVDDGSIDASGDVAAAFGGPVHVLRLEQRGIGAARNTGVAAAPGAVIGFLDADDRWTSDKLAIQLELMTADVDMVSGWTAQVPQAEWDRVVREGPAPGMVRMAPMPGTLLVRRSVFERVGPYDETLRAGESLDWYARAMHLGARMAISPKVVLLRRIHGASHGTRFRDGYVDYLTVARMAVARRRERETTR